MRGDILTLMLDGKARTSYEICDQLFGPQADGRTWFAVSLVCDRLVAYGHLQSCGKVQHRTVYQFVDAGLTTGV